MQNETKPEKIIEEIYQIKNYFTQNAFDSLYSKVLLERLTPKKDVILADEEIHSAYKVGIHSKDNVASSTQPTITTPSNHVHFMEPYVTEFLYKTKENLSLIYKTSIYLETAAAIVLFFPGEGIQTHWDGSVEGTPTHSGNPSRDYSTVFYFNDDFEGGLLHFTELDIKIKPEPNLILLFPTTILYSHCVEVVTSGIRMMSPGFWSSNKKNIDIQ